MESSRIVVTVLDSAEVASTTSRLYHQYSVHSRILNSVKPQYHCDQRRSPTGSQDVNFLLPSVPYLCKQTNLNLIRFPILLLTKILIALALGATYVSQGVTICIANRIYEVKIHVKYNIQNRK